MHETEARALTHVEYRCIIGPNFSRSSAGTSLVGEGQFTPPCRRWSNSPTHTTDACCSSSRILLVARLSEELTGFPAFAIIFTTQRISVNEEQQPVAFSASRKQHGPEMRVRPTFWHHLRAPSLSLYMLRPTPAARLVTVAVTQVLGRVRISALPFLSNISLDSSASIPTTSPYLNPIKPLLASLEARAVLASKTWYHRPGHFKRKQHPQFKQAPPSSPRLSRMQLGRPYLSPQPPSTAELFLLFASRFLAQKPSRRHQA